MTLLPPLPAGTLSPLTPFAPTFTNSFWLLFDCLQPQTPTGNIYFYIYYLYFYIYFLITFFINIAIFFNNIFIIRFTHFFIIFYRSVGERFDVGKSSLSVSFMKIIDAWNEIADDVIQ